MNIKRTIQAVAVPAVSLLYASPALAGFNKGVGMGASETKPQGSSNELFGAAGVFNTIGNILIYLTGAIAVIMLVFGGLRYVTSAGDAARVKAAKDTILYGIIGVVVAILAYAIINFVTQSLAE